MAKSMRSKREKRLRAIRREIVEPLNETKEAAKLAAPKLLIRSHTATTMEITTAAASASVPNSDMAEEIIKVSLTKVLLRTLIEIGEKHGSDIVEAVKGGGGSIKVGTTGTINSLISRELESMKHAPRMAVSSRDKSSAATILLHSGVTSPKRLRPRSSANEASSNRSNSITIETLSLSGKQNITPEKPPFVVLSSIVSSWNCLILLSCFCFKDMHVDF